MAEIPPADTENLWRQYQVLVDLYKYYFDLILSSATFVNGIVAAITIYALKQEEKYVAWVIFIPGAIALASSTLFFLSIPMALELDEALEHIVNTLGVGLAPHAELLVYALSIFAILYFLVVAILFRLATMSIKKKTGNGSYDAQ